jgi:lysophospholipase L1-like esterase
MKTIAALLVTMLVAAFAGAQNLPQLPLIPPHANTVNVVLFGHSWIVLMQGFQPWAFPNIPSNHVSVQGYGGYTCEMLIPPLRSSVPPSTNAVFLMTATNDVLENIPVDEHIACMQTIIGILIGENPSMLILASNVPPLGKNVKDHRDAISQYNQAYLTLPQMYPNNVKVVDMWTPMVDVNGWALANMFRDGVHFNQNGQDLVMGTIRDSLYSNLPQ